MKIVLAPDKFKGNMSAMRFCEIVSEAFRSVMPSIEIISLPMADGGEGTLDAVLAATGGERVKIEVTGPLADRKTIAEFGIFNNGKSGIFEMSSASGMALLKRDELDPIRATTFGTGEIIKALLDRGVEDITIGIGGSATVDGGAGMAQALGYRLLDASGNELPPGGGALINLDSIDIANVDQRIFKTVFRTACDVTSPLLGLNGASHVFAPQKGATPTDVETLENALSHLADVWNKQKMLDSVEVPGDGAAGGLGAGLRAFCRSTPVKGARLVMDKLEFAKHLSCADLVITGEGRADSQTDAGKLCSEIAAEAHKHGVKVLLIAGSVAGSKAADCFDFAMSTSTGHGSIEENIAHGQADLAFTALNLARLIDFGLKHGNHECGGVK